MNFYSYVEVNLSKFIYADIPQRSIFRRSLDQTYNWGSCSDLHGVNHTVKCVVSTGMRPIILLGLLS